MIIRYSFALDCSHQGDNSGMYIQTYVISLSPLVQGLFCEYALCIFESHELNKILLPTLRWKMNNLMRSWEHIQYDEVCQGNLK